jgi:lipoic acid synthetase
MNILDEEQFRPVSAPPLLPPNPEGAGRGRFPSWLHRPLPVGRAAADTGALLAKYGLNTVCEEAKCPNRFECYTHKTATFLALGKACTRSCGFCDIDFTKVPQPPEEDEPLRIALSAKELELRHVVITMVARDDLPDGGAAHVAAIMRAVRAENFGVTVEVLISDLGGNQEALDLVLNERPDVFNHNLETVRALTPRVRHRATYDRTLGVLRAVRSSGKAAHIKSGIMVGLGETASQVEETLRDLHAVGCSIVTMGQYLQPNRRKLLVKEFVTPDQFAHYEQYGRSLGIHKMYCGPFVRSSYHAHDVFHK